MSPKRNSWKVWVGFVFLFNSDITATVYPIICFRWQFLQKKKKDPELVINHRLNMSQQCHAVVKKPDVRWNSTSRSVSCKTGDVVSEPVGTRSKHLVQLWEPYQETQGPTRVRPGKGCGNDELSAKRGQQRLRRGSTWREEDTRTVFWNVKGSCKQGPDCSQCPIWVWRDRDLTLQERRFKLCVKGKLLKVRFANHSNGWCGASGKKTEVLETSEAGEINIGQGWCWLCWVCLEKGGN